MAAMLEPVSQPFTHGPRQTADGSAARQRPDPDQGVFETLLVLDGRPVEFDAHLARLHASLDELFGDRPAPAIAGRVEEVAARSERSAVRAVVAPGSDGSLRAEVRSRPQRGDFLSLSDRNAPRPVELRSLEVGGGLGGHKWADRTLLDETQAGLPADSLPLIVDSDGTVLEASRANLFAVRDGALFTPPLDGRILPGVTRMRVLELAGEVGIDAHEAELSRADLLAADEAFLTGSVRGIERAKSLDGAPLQSRTEITDRLATELWQAWTGTRAAI